MGWVRMARTYLDNVNYTEGTHISIEGLRHIIEKYDLKPKKDSRRRMEIARIGCELFCFNENDIIYILDDKNDIYDVEMLFRRRRNEAV